MTMSPGNSKPILVVDDDEPTQKLMQALMRRFGYQTHTASNGGEAIERLQANEYALVVLDLMMPNVSGIDVIAFLDSKESRTPVIVCTAAGPARTMNVDSPLVKAVVRKPFDIDEFSALVGSLAGGPSAPTRVLIVDDDMRARYIMRAFLDSAEVIEAESGDAAFAMIARTRPDVVFLDLMMPGMPGDDFLRKFREATDTTTIPVFIVTSRKLTEDDRNELLKLAAGIIYKGDLSRETIQQALKSVLSR
jgi:CheY-like chemotaxis protein